MKSFSFSLANVLNWHRTQCDLREAAVRRFSLELEQVNSQLAQLRAVKVAGEQAVLSARELTRRDLEALAGYRIRFRKHEAALLGMAREHEARIAEERRQWLEARRRVRMFEKLRARRLEQYDYERDRELEQFAAEMYLAQWQARVT
jgi:flagellar export protein FliJ